VPLATYTAVTLITVLFGLASFSIVTALGSRPPRPGSVPQGGQAAGTGPGRPAAA